MKQKVSVQERLLREMKSGVYAGAAKLPPENELAKRMQISRTSLRDALARLEREGFITRRHGVGTMINRHVLDIPVRMDLEIEFTEMIAQSGHSAERMPAQIVVRHSDDNIASKLSMTSGEPVLYAGRMIHADGKPAIWCEDYIPMALISTPEKIDREAERSTIFDFLAKFCGEEPYMDLARIDAVAADAHLSEAFGVPDGSPLLYLDEVDYDIAGLPILYSRQFYAPGVIPQTIQRRKI